MGKYITKENCELYLNKEITGNIDLFINSAETHIDKYTGRNFKATEQTRLYDGNNGEQLIIDWATEITKVELDGVDITDEIITYPYNETPVYKLIRKNNVFTRDFKNVSVEGKFGVADCPPADIKMVATILTAGLYQSSRGGGEVLSEKIGNYSVSYTNDQQSDFENVKEILDNYRKFNVF